MFLSLYSFIALSCYDSHLARPPFFPPLSATQFCYFRGWLDSRSSQELTHLQFPLYLCQGLNRLISDNDLLKGCAQLESLRRWFPLGALASAVSVSICSGKAASLAALSCSKEPAASLTSLFHSRGVCQVREILVLRGITGS